MKQKYLPVAALLVFAVFSAQALGLSSGSLVGQNEKGDLLALGVSERLVGGIPTSLPLSSRLGVEERLYGDFVVFRGGKREKLSDDTSSIIQAGVKERWASGPGSWAMLLSGLGLMCAVALRRNRR